MIDFLVGVFVGAVGLGAINYFIAVGRDAELWGKGLREWDASDVTWNPTSSGPSMTTAWRGLEDTQVRVRKLYDQDGER